MNFTWQSRPPASEQDLTAALPASAFFLHPLAAPAIPEGEAANAPQVLIHRPVGRGLSAPDPPAGIGAHPPAPCPPIGYWPGGHLPSAQARSDVSARTTARLAANLYMTFEPLMTFEIPQHPKESFSPVIQSQIPKNPLSASHSQPVQSPVLRQSAERRKLRKSGHD
ncbi:hypothetical protein SMG44B_10508 [Stenotrophomonas maltophilia]